MTIMKVKYLTILAAIVAMMSLASCSDFLDKAPDTRVELNTIQQLKELMVNGYTTTNYAIIELATDNVIDNNSPDKNGMRFNLPSYEVSDEEIYAWEDVKSGMSNDSPSGIWSGCYSAIAVANAVLERVDEFEKNPSGLTDDELVELAAVKGEALLSRAYHHFILVNVFCMPYQGEKSVPANQYMGIPYVKTPETTVKPHYDRGTVDQVYANIEADLEEGLPLIDDAIYEQPKYHFNRAAANAFAARFYIFKRDYEKALKYADAAFNGQDPATMMNTIWLHRSELYYISDIARYFTNVERNGVWMNFTTYSVFARRRSSRRYTCNRDARDATIRGPGPTWENCRWRNSATNETFSMHPCFNGTCGTAGQQEYGRYFGGTCGEQFEYTDKLAGIGYAHMVRSEFTAEETLLCRAEAKLFLGDIEGCYQDLKIWDDGLQNLGETNNGLVPLTKELIQNFYSKCENQWGYGIALPIRIDEVCPVSKYKLTAEMEPFMQCIQHYRRIWTIHTGQRWFDIKRLGLSIEHKIGRYGRDRLEFMDSRYAMQIPAEVLSAGFEPSPRWAVNTEEAEATVEPAGTYVRIN